mgnify:FL=1
MYHPRYTRANVFIFVLYLYALFNLYILSKKKQTVYDIFPRNQCYLYPSGVPDPVTNTDVPVLVLPTIDSLLTKLDFLPQAVPADLADKLERFHGDPAVWWIGQVVSYLIRPNSDLRLYLTESEQNVTRQGPIVG